MNFLKFIKWFSIILIYPIVLFIIRQSQVHTYSFSFILILFIVCLSLHFVVVLIFYRLKKQERFHGNTSQSDQLTEKKIELCLVAKNEGENLIRIISHYLMFPENFRITVYDDSSDDGSFERLLDFAADVDKRLTVKRLVRTSKTLHPKGMGVEDFIDSTEADFIMINDADTVVNQHDFEKAILYLEEMNYDVVHLSRRNDLNQKLVTRVSDLEEMNNTALKILGITDYCFPGSGILMTLDAARLVNYSEFVPGDDLEMGRQLKKAGKKIYHFQTVFAHEKAPSRFSDFFSQRAKWSRNIAYHLFENERFGAYIQNTAAAFALFFLFGLSSPVSLFIILTGISYTMLSIYTNTIFAERTILTSIIPAAVNTFQLWLQAAVFTPFYMLVYPIKRKRMDYKKSRV